jgi:hypothetical protein
MTREEEQTRYQKSWRKQFDDAGDALSQGSGVLGLAVVVIAILAALKLAGA